MRQKIKQKGPVPESRSGSPASIGKDIAILRIIGEIAGVSTVDALGRLEQGVSDNDTIGEFCAVLSGSIKSSIESKGSTIPEVLKSSLSSLCSDLCLMAKNVENDSIKVEDARWRITNLLQVAVLENNLSGYISLDAFNKMEEQLRDMQGKAREDNLRQTITILPFASAAYDDYVSAGHKRVTCFEGTRQELLKKVGEWVAKSESNIYVLFGLAGIGKSTIAQTIAKSADSIGLLGASFFFSRDDADRRTAKLFFTTIAFQLCVHDEDFADAIEGVLQTEKGKAATMKLPLEQLEVLILKPLAKLPPRKVVILVDALDECDDEEGPTVLMGLYNLVQRFPSFKVVLTTRPQLYIQFHLDGLGSHKIFHLHNIDDEIVDGDIRCYLKYHLSTKAVQAHFKDPEEDWNASDAEIESLVQAAGRLFIIASTSVVFILDKVSHDPEHRMQVLLEAISHDTVPFNILNNFYTVILRSALPKGSDSHAVRRYQTVIGAIMVIQIPLGIETLAKLINSRPRDIRRVLEKLQPVILIDDGSDTPRVYHKSLADYIHHPERCADDDLRIDTKAHHTRVAICCFMIMAQRLRRNILELRGPAYFMYNHDALEGQGITDDQLRKKIPLELEYACLYFANHMEGANSEDTSLIHELQGFTNERLLNWMEALSWIGKLDSAYQALLIVEKLTKLVSPDVHQLIGDGLHFFRKSNTLIRLSALHTYHSALPCVPTKTSLYGRYSKQMSSICRVQGSREEWDAIDFTLFLGEEVNQVTFSVDNTMFACHKQSEMTIHDANTGIEIRTIDGEELAIACDFSKAAASENNTITLYRVKGVTPTAIIKAVAEVWHLEFSPEGSRLLAVLADDTISVWNTDDGELIVASERWKGQSISVVSSNGATGMFAITLDNDTGIFVIDVSSCDIVAILDFSVHVEELSPVLLAKFSGDGSRLACLVVAYETAALNLWNSKDGTFIGAIENAGDDLAISNDGSLVATWEGKILKLWSANHLLGDPLIQTFNLFFDTDPRGEIVSVAFARNDLLAVSSSYTAVVLLYDIRSHTFLPDIHFVGTTTMSFSSDCTRLATVDGNLTMYIWNVLSIKSQPQLSSPTTLSLSPDCSWLATGYGDGSINLWDTSDATVPFSTRKGHLKHITALVFNVDGSKFASGSEDEFIGLWSVKDDVQDGSLECSNEYVFAMAMSSQVLVAATDTDITLYDIKTYSVMGKLAQTGTSRLTLSNDCSLLAVAFNGELVIHS